MSDSCGNQAQRYRPDVMARKHAAAGGQKPAAPGSSASAYMLFQDLIEQENCFASLDALANQPNREAKTDFNNINLGLMRCLHMLVERILQAEKDQNFKPETMSYQRMRVVNLIRILEASDNAAKLAAAMPVIKELLYKAWVFDLEIEYGKMKPIADIGNNRLTQVRNWSKKGLEAINKERVLYSETEKNDWRAKCEKMKCDDPSLKIRAIARLIIKNEKLTASFETVHAALKKRV